MNHLVLVFLHEEIIAGSCVIFNFPLQTAEQVLFGIPKLVLNFAHNQPIYVFLLTKFTATTVALYLSIAFLH